ncbi:hypothetical protein [Duganella sp. CY15W]|uniref:hypothetical protein n=1 Tax=Duganella sp. CY15W TaxID=2692172 RepID=UPI00136C7913|nr:hypothetical protein [Duganella sp. CY15W]
MLTMLDIYTREALDIEVGPSLRGEYLMTALNRLVAHRAALPALTFFARTASPPKPLAVRL